MKKILVLGHKGMLGHIVENYLSSNNKFQIRNIIERWPSKSFKQSIRSFCEEEHGDFIINCIGAIHQKTNSFDINTSLPIWLEKNTNTNYSKCKIIHPGTDCELDNDDYGISKRKASEFIIGNGLITKIIKTSIIGPELSSRASLFEWFINNNNNQIDGYSKCYWNGNTTLQWSIICEDMINNWDNYNILSIPATACITKYELLNTIKKIFNKKIIINKKEFPKIDKCLKGNVNVPLIAKQLLELKKYINKPPYLNLTTN